MKKEKVARRCEELEYLLGKNPIENSPSSTRRQGGSRLIRKGRTQRTSTFHFHIREKSHPYETLIFSI